jgi:hypothetical protein
MKRRQIISIFLKHVWRTSLIHVFASLLSVHFDYHANFFFILLKHLKNSVGIEKKNKVACAFSVFMYCDNADFSLRCLSLNQHWLSLVTVYIKSIFLRILALHNVQIQPYIDCNVHLSHYPSTVQYWMSSSYAKNTCSWSWMDSTVWTWLGR